MKHEENKTGCPKNPKTRMSTEEAVMPDVDESPGDYCRYINDSGMIWQRPIQPPCKIMWQPPFYRSFSIKFRTSKNRSPFALGWFLLPCPHKNRSRLYSASP